MERQEMGTQSGRSRPPFTPPIPM
ncbi:uncharacterized protein G2W53_020991 [Senna tora]|uniref:Uncharacterized protein n=1 Tax=Senna tora TaxID=362788 RepID=A0A834WHF5_9FABA|nr:uncharacterized protein G2W53_020991 [Senna tora]